MKLNFAIGTLLATTLLIYAIGFMGHPFIFIIFFPIAISITLITIFLTIANFTWALVPLSISKRYEKRKKRIYFVGLFSLILFLSGGWAINHYYLPNKYSIISLLGNFGILIFTMLLAWNLIHPHKKRMLIAGGVGTVLFLFIFISANIVTNSASKESSVKIEKLKTLPYLSYVVEERNIEENGVLIYKKNLCDKGVNIYHSHLLPGAYLIDLSGKVLHKWETKQSPPDWGYTELYGESDLLVIIKDKMLMRLDWNSNIKWKERMRFHHDIDIDENKDIYVLARKDELVFISFLPMPLLNDYIVVLTPNGKIKKEISLYKILKKHICFDKTFQIFSWLLNPKNLKSVFNQMRDRLFLFWYETPLDIFHTNTIEIIGRDINTVFKKGNILFCSKMLNMIGIIDIEEEKLLWHWGINHLELPHHPTLLENGNILIFDNGATNRKYSRIIELNPITEEIIWEYKDNSLVPFYSSWGGANQRLPNGNTLITESSKGRVFEVTNDGDIVWEFYNPIKEKGGKRAPIYRMMRITNLEDYSELKKLE